MFPPLVVVSRVVAGVLLAVVLLVGAVAVVSWAVAGPVAVVPLLVVVVSWVVVLLVRAVVGPVWSPPSELPRVVLPLIRIASPLVCLPPFNSTSIYTIPGVFKYWT